MMTTSDPLAFSGLRYCTQTLHYDNVKECTHTYICKQHKFLRSQMAARTEPFSCSSSTFWLHRKAGNALILQQAPCNYPNLSGRMEHQHQVETYLQKVQKTLLCSQQKFYFWKEVPESKQTSSCMAGSVPAVKPLGCMAWAGLIQVILHCVISDLCRHTS